MQTPPQKTRSSLKRQEGQSIVEFVIVLPLLVMLIVGIAQFGLAFHDYLSITDATRVGARAAAVKRAAGACEAANAAILNTLSGSQQIEVSRPGRITCETPEGTDTGDRITLTVKHRYSIGLPGFSASGDLTANATERLE